MNTERIPEEGMSPRASAVQAPQIETQDPKIKDSRANILSLVDMALRAEAIEPYNVL